MIFLCVPGLMLLCLIKHLKYLAPFSLIAEVNGERGRYVRATPVCRAVICIIAPLLLLLLLLLSQLPTVPFLYVSVRVELEFVIGKRRSRRTRNRLESGIFSRGPPFSCENMYLRGAGWCRGFTGRNKKLDFWLSVITAPSNAYVLRKQHRNRKIVPKQFTKTPAAIPALLPWVFYAAFGKCLHVGRMLFAGCESDGPRRGVLRRRGIHGDQP